MPLELRAGVDRGGARAASRREDRGTKGDGDGREGEGRSGQKEERRQEASCPEGGALTSRARLGARSLVHVATCACVLPMSHVLTLSLDV